MTLKYSWVIVLILCALVYILLADSITVTPVKQMTEVIEIHTGNHAKIIDFCSGDKEYAYLIEVKDFNYTWYGSLAECGIKIFLAFMGLLTAIMIFYKKFFAKKKRGK